MLVVATQSHAAGARKMNGFQFCLPISIGGGRLRHLAETMMILNTTRQANSPMNMALWCVCGGGEREREREGRGK